MAKTSTRRTGETEHGDLKGEITALKRERIVGAAVDLIYDKGYENTTLDAVAEHLGVTKPFIYTYFHSKSDLLAEICSRGIRSSLEAINAAEADTQGQGARVKLMAIVERFVGAVLESQKHIAIFSREEKNLAEADFQRISGYRRQFDKQLTALLDEGVAAGEFQIRDARLASLAIGGLVSWAYVWFRPHGRLSIATIAAELSNLVVAMTRGQDIEARPVAAVGRKRPKPREDARAKRPARGSIE